MREQLLRSSWSHAALGALSALLAISCLLAPPKARAAEQVMTRADILQLASEHRALCEGWRDQDQSCQSLLFLDVKAGGQLSETNRLQIADEPDVAVGILSDASLDGVAICTTLDLAPGHTVILMDGEPSDSEMAGQFLTALRASLAIYDGKRACETFRRDEATGVIRSTTTIDGKPAPELSSVYRQLPDTARVRMRPIIQGDSDEQSI